MLNINNGDCYIAAEAGRQDIKGQVKGKRHVQKKKGVENRGEHSKAAAIICNKKVQQTTRTISWAINLTMKKKMEGQPKVLTRVH